MGMAWTLRARCPRGGIQLCPKACHFPSLKNAKNAQKFQDTSKFLSFELVGGFLSLFGSFGAFEGLLLSFIFFYGGGKQLALPKGLPFSLDQKRNFVLLFFQDISKELTLKQLKNIQLDTQKMLYVFTKFFNPLFSFLFQPKNCGM